jgi:SAM-dependent methyltransferase
VLAQVYEAHQEWETAAVEAVARFLLEPRPRSAAFLGCASGANDALPFARLAPDVPVLASDVDPDFLRALRARAPGNMEVRHVDIRRLDGLGVYDAVALFFVIHRVPGGERLAPSIARLVAPGGRFYASEFAGPDGLLYLANEGARGRDPVSRLLRRYAELRPFHAPLKSTNIRPFLDALPLRPEGHRDVPWRQSLSVRELLRRMELGAHAPFVGTPPELLDRLRREFPGDERRELTETIRVYRFAA